MIRFTITYDISLTKKRNRLVKILEEYGQRVQYSIFEFKLTEAQYISLMKRLKEKNFLRIDKKQLNDSITIYYFDQNTESKIKRYGKAPVIDKDMVTFI